MTLNESLCAHVLGDKLLGFRLGKCSCIHLLCTRQSFIRHCRRSESTISGRKSVLNPSRNKNGVHCSSVEGGAPLRNLESKYGPLRKQIDQLETPKGESYHILKACVKRGQNKNYSALKRPTPGGKTDTLAGKKKHFCPCTSDHSPLSRPTIWIRIDRAPPPVATTAHLAAAAAAPHCCSSRPEPRTEKPSTRPSKVRLIHGLLIPSAIAVSMLYPSRLF